MCIEIQSDTHAHGFFTHMSRHVYKVGINVYIYIYTHTHSVYISTYLYRSMYIYMCVCSCACLHGRAAGPAISSG